MFCKYCGKEVGESNFCPNCGHELDPKKNLNSNIKDDDTVKDVETNSPDSNRDPAFNKQAFKKSKWFYLLIGVAVYFIFTLFTGGKITDEDYIGCAQTAISEQLKSPSTAEFSEGEVIEKDKYGRAMVTMTVDAQNGFGAYVRNKFVVVINTYDKKTKEFTYKKTCVVELEDGELSNFTAQMLKVESDWDKPIEGD